MVGPTVNSYKRTGATSTASGASWAPRLPTYGGNDRTHYIRVPDAHRVELRGGDGSANPYLAIAAALGAGLDGIKRSLDPGAVGSGVSTRALPPDAAARRRRARGRRGGHRCARRRRRRGRRLLRRLKREEFFAWHSTVSPWEIDRYLTASEYRERRRDQAMCGIVGLHLRDPELYPRLGELLTGMLCEMCERGSRLGRRRRLRRPDLVARRPRRRLACSTLGTGRSRHSPRLGRRGARRGVDGVDLATPTCCRRAVAVGGAARRRARRLSRTALDRRLRRGPRRLKGVGHPRRARPRRSAWPSAQGWQGVAHTRMATESAVTPAGCAPLLGRPGPVPGAQRLVRQPRHHPPRAASARACVFDSENDTEVGARFVAQQLAAGRRPGEGAAGCSARRFDGFYTLLVTNRDSFAVVRDAIACKPAVIAETDDWVAMASRVPRAGRPARRRGRPHLRARTGGGVRMAR